MYRYSPKILEDIALNYRLIYYDGLPEKALTMMPLIEAKCDLDIALDKLGHGNWLKVAERMRRYNLVLEEMYIDLWQYGNMQKVVIAEMTLIEDDELERRYHILEPEALRGRAFERMAEILNGRY